MNDLESSQFILDAVGLAHKEALWNSKVQHPEKNVFSISQRVRSSRLFKHENAVGNLCLIFSAFHHILLSDFVRVGHALVLNVSS